MHKLLPALILVPILGLFTAAPCLADNCTEARQIVDEAIKIPPATKTEAVFKAALRQCPNHPKLYDLIGDYYNHWWQHDINPQHRARYNYLATEYYADGIKSGKGKEVKEMQYKLAALENSTKDISPVGIRSIRPGIRLNVKVYFNFNSAKLTPGAQKELDILGHYLTEDNASRIVLEGHTDMSGPEAYNKTLSVDRAKSAKQYLVRKFDIPPQNIEVKGYGFERLADVDNPYSAKNRRVRVRKLP
jgi:outer membrane protein OmpA-like peptidoglycan-associated protein